MTRLSLLLLLLLGPASAAGPIRVLIVDGVNNHDWRTLTGYLQAILGAHARFVVDVSTSPPAVAAAGAWEQWRPQFDAYDVVVNNFNGGHLTGALRWPHEVEEAFQEYVRSGGGLVNVHAANNAFLDWPAYNEMIGLGWREPEFGASLIVDPEGKVERLPPGKGRRPGHGPSHDFIVTVLDSDHPIYRGVPRAWLHPFEQLTHGQHGPANNLTVLSYAWSQDTGENEVVDWTVAYGQGRVYTTMLGHTPTSVISDNSNIRCVGFQTVIARAVEWAATGAATIPVPRGFPTAEQIRLGGPVGPNSAGLGLRVR